MRRLHAALGYLLLAPALLPLLWTPAFYYPYVDPKTFAFRALGILVLAALVCLMLARQELHVARLKQKVTWIPAALLVTEYVASLFGAGFYHSFWSMLERGDGLLTTTVAVLFFYAVVLHADSGFVRRLAAVSTWVGGLVALYAFLQWVERSAGTQNPIIEIPTSRIGATFGSGPFMASYLGMTLFLTLWWARECRNKQRILAGTSAGMQLLAIFISTTRGTILTLGVAAFIAAIYAAWKGEARLRLAGRISLAGFVACLVLFAAFRAQLALVPIAAVQRIAAISTADVTVSSRLFVWQNIGHEAMKHPLAGVGAENIEQVFNAIYDPDLIGEDLFDRSHNSYLDYLVQFGVPGLLFYLALILAALRAAYVVVRAGDALGGYLFLLVVTNAVQNFVLFDTALTFWLLLAVLASLVTLGKSSPRPLPIPDMRRSIPAVISLAILLLLIPVAVLPARASVLLAQAHRYFVADTRRAVGDLAEGFSLNTYADLEYGCRSYQMYIDAQARMPSDELRVLAHQEVVGILTQNFARYPGDSRTANCLAQAIDVTPAGATRDIPLLNKALDRAILLVPHRLQSWYIRANIELRMADVAADKADRNAHLWAAMDVLKECTRSHPRSAEVRFSIAGLYLAMEDQDQAQVWANAGSAIYRPSPGAGREAATYYLRTSQWANAARYLHDVVVADPADNSALYSLAKAKFLSGDKAGAQAIVNQLRAQSPGILDSDPAFLADLEKK